MALEKKVFAGGGMDSDTDERFVAKNDYKKALNCRISSSDEANDGIIENIRSNKKIENLWNFNPAANKVIGAYEDKERNVVIFFVAGARPNSDPAGGGNSIYEYDPETEIVTKILGDVLLMFSKKNLITGINVVGSDSKFPDGLLYWTDDVNPPRKINIEKAKRYTVSGGADPLGYGVITYKLLDAIKAPPVNQAMVSDYLTDTTRNTNQLKGQSWQFKYRWVYQDGEKSTWSPISKMMIDERFNSIFNTTGAQTLDNNVIPVGFTPGPEDVQRIQIACRKTNGTDDFILVSDIDKDDIKEKVGTSAFLIDQVTSLPDTTGTVFYFYFYNDSIYSTINTVESNKLYNDVPHYAKAQEIVDGNRLVYGNVVTGQDGLTNMDTTLVADHPVESQVEDLGEEFPLIPEVRARRLMHEGASTPCGARRKPQFEFRLRFRLTDIAPGCFRTYSITLRDCRMVGAMTEQGSGTGFGYTRTFAHWASMDINGYISALFDENFTPNDQALSMAADLNAQPNLWPIFMLGPSSSAVTTGSQQDSVYNSFAATNWSASGDYLMFTATTFVDVKRFTWQAYGNWITTCEIQSNNVTGDTGWQNTFATVADVANNQSTCGCRIVRTRTSCGWGDIAGNPGRDVINGIGSSVNIPTPSGNSVLNIPLTNQDHRNRLVQINLVAGDTANRDSSLYQDACPGAGGESPIVPSFKTGAYHKFGLVYYDRAMRSSSVQLDETAEVYIPTVAESGWQGEWYVDWTISHSPPPWAEYYQWVYGGNTLTNRFVQFVTGGFWSGRYASQDIGGVEGAPYTNNILVDITAISAFQKAEGGNVVVYDYQVGDILRFVRDAGDNASPEEYEFKISGVVGRDGNPPIWTTPGGNTVFPFTDPDRVWLMLANETTLLGDVDTVNPAPIGAFVNYTLEIYSPKPKAEEEQTLYHEFAQYGMILNPGTALAVHNNILVDPNGIPQSLVPAVPASGRFTRGDVYYRNRTSKTPKLVTPVESFHFSDRFKSDFYDKGRPNAFLEDFRRSRKHSTCLYSEPYIPNTNINGLHSIFPDVSFVEFERSYNSIQKLHSRDNKLIIFQEDKVSQSLVKRNIIYNVDGSGNVATADSVLSQAVPYLGNYGINKNPESFASYGNRMYFADIKRAAILRLSQDGFTPISKANMNNFFTDKMDYLFKTNIMSDIGRLNIYGVYDVRFNEYIVSFEEVDTCPVGNPITYDCIDGQCVKICGDYGVYETLTDCQNTCQGNAQQIVAQLRSQETVRSSSQIAAAEEYERKNVTPNPYTNPLLGSTESSTSTSSSSSSSSSTEGDSSGGGGY
tara:strand:+ start:2331 stop:6257 length:3927 start_codon:yes stop_codon:yes gene_type:complete